MTFKDATSNLLYLFGLLVCYLFITFTFTEDVNSFFQIPDSIFPGVYFAPIVVSEHNLTRIGTEYKVWGNNLKFYSKESVFIPVATFSINKTFPKTVIYKPPKNAKKVHRLIYGFKEAMLDFYNNTSLNWFFRLTDDVYVDMENFALFINKLDEKYDPKKRAIIKGQLCATYLHGGSGWIISRRAVELVLNVWDKVELSDSPDDVIAPNIWEKAGLDTREMHSDQFLGSRLNEKYEEISAWKKLRACKTKIITRVSDIAVWHAGSNSMSVVVHGNEILRTVPENVYINLLYDGKIGICSKDSNSNFLI